MRSIPSLVVVPGHGAIGGQEIVAQQLNYLMTLRRLAKHCAKENLSEDDAAKALPIPPAFEKLGFSEWWPANVRCVYREVVSGH